MEKPNSRIAKFDREFKYVDLARFYQLKKGLYETIEIDKKVADSSIYLTIQYTKENLVLRSTCHRKCWPRFEVI